ncbi:endo-1,4-beta-xylanase [Luteimonas sp. SJ-92]|uniref:endo-1,4-beta-xylanase n=1 Tax=Luteimonas salinisoli TaxID=2752307 RepID=A0A853J9S9_9GAMM|nr:endo-1,4-beta-xylanase [Luteimonas salinisoli]NZA25428.1 endo-1,4-beta-xylanase [Luteimonas salinisoli]
MNTPLARLLAATLVLPLALAACGPRDAPDPDGPPPEADAGAPTATALAAGQEKFLGSAHSPPQADDFAVYWNKVTPENGGKWGEVEAERDVMDWTALDAAWGTAQAHGLPFQMHVMVWGNQQPEWIEALPVEEQRAEIEEWFAAVAARYPGIDYVEVVNEPLNDPPSKDDEGGGNYVQALGGDGASGWDWILEAFRLAREHFPTSRLMINEYSITNDPDATARYLEIVRLLQAEGLIDAIGVQGHAFSTTTETPMSVHRANLDALGATGLPVYVTELDVDGPDDDTQLRDYQRIFPVFWEHPAVRGVTLWGFRPGLWRQEQGAYLVREDGSERPALAWLRRYVRGEVSAPRQDAEEASPAGGDAGGAPE